MASNQGAEIAWLVMAATCHETFGYGRDRLARLKQNSMNNYKQYLEVGKKRIRTSPSTVCADAYRMPSKRTSASLTPTTARDAFDPGQRPQRIRDGRCLLGDIQEGQSRTGSGPARRIQRSKVRRNHDGRPKTGQRYARLMTICPKRVPGQTPGMPRPLRTVCGEQGGIPEDETGSTTGASETPTAVGGRTGPSCAVSRRNSGKGVVTMYEVLFRA